MAGSPWQFTLLPDSISTVTITDGSTTVTVNRGSGKTGDAFLTGAFTETTIVTISAEGYNDLTNVTVGDTNLVMTPASSKPEYLYAYTDPNATGETLYAWQSPYNPDLGDTLYYMDSNNNAVYIPYNTIYTKTNVIDTSTSVYYLSDGTELPLYNLNEALYSADYIKSADANQISIHFVD